MSRVARDALRSVRIVRQRMVEQARYALAVCLQSEAEAEARIRAIDAAIAQDRAAHQLVEDAHQFHETFAMRDRARLVERGSAEAILAAVKARSAEARGAVAEARTGMKAVETLMTERQVAADAEAERRAQHALDDVVRGRAGVKRAGGGVR